MRRKRPPDPLEEHRPNAGVEFYRSLRKMNEILCAEFACSPRKISVSSYDFCSKQGFELLLALAL